MKWATFLGWLEFHTSSKKCVSTMLASLAVLVGLPTKIQTQILAVQARRAPKVILILNTLKAETKNHSFLNKNRIRIRIRIKTKHNRTHSHRIEIHTKTITPLEKRRKCQCLIKAQLLMAASMNRTMMLNNLIVKVLIYNRMKKLNNKTIR